MKIVIDLQGAQSESRHRGIGRYTKSMALALAEVVRGEHDLWITLNADLGHGTDSLRECFEALLPPDRIVSYSLPAPLAAAMPGNDWRRSAAERLRENFLRDMQADWVWHTSLFEGWSDEAATSTGLMPSAAGQAATLYDLIPLTRPGEYLADPRVHSWYMRKIDHLQRQDLYFAISDWTRHEGSQLLGLPEERIAIATCGVESIFGPLEPSAIDAGRQRLRLVHGVHKDFVFYMGGFDSRKNVSFLIVAFAQLPDSTRAEHSLVIGGRIGDVEKAFLLAVMRRHGLAPNEVIFTGQIDDKELVELYCTCSLFVFPSLHEGFGLTVLEAMACGAPVLAANATSLPEVVGRADMLFDPANAEELTERMARLLADSVLRQELSEYGKRRAGQFSWRHGAEQMAAAFEKHAKVTDVPPVAAGALSKRPRLAYVSPLPPEQSGISDYSAELLPELSRHYAIDVIVQQDHISDAWITANLPTRSVAWFEANAHRFERILYQFGNSHFHLHMFDLLKRFPGTVVLHDSFLGGLSHWRSFHAGYAEDYLRRLYLSHGHRALLDDQERGRDFTMQYYPSNAEIFDSAMGIMVHSQYAIDQARAFHGEYAATWMRKIAFPKARCVADKIAARRQLDVAPDAFVVSSFGMLAPTKLNHRLLDAWLASSLATRADCRLVFVGENHGGDYGHALTERIAEAGASSVIEITGFVKDATYKTWLATADVAVQLRVESRGETSAAVFDCLSHGLPLIVNAHATFAELPDDCVVKLADEFADQDLVVALEQLHASASSREKLGKHARQEIAEKHALPLVAMAYRDSIEAFAATHPLAAEMEVIDAVAGLSESVPMADDLWRTSRALVRNRKPMHLPRLFIDVTVVCGNDLRTGIERVTRNLSRELLKCPPSDYRVEPVRLVDGVYRYACAFASRLLGTPELGLADKIVEPVKDDIFLGLDWVADQIPHHVGLFQSWRNLGVAVYFMVYDLLPVLQPQFFPPKIDRMHALWLSSIARCADGLICISETVAEELRLWLDANPAARECSLLLGYSHIGADLDGDIEKTPPSSAEEQMLAQLAARPTVLVVGTIEPRKGHQLVLDAFDALWAQRHDLNLVIVGKQGWMMEAFGQRLLRHDELGTRLFWNSGISDALLNQLYQAADVLLVASEGEGFGLPLIEAAQHGIPVIARDLPVFREIAGAHVTYFHSSHAAGLADAIRQWFVTHSEGRAPSSAHIPWLSWANSAKRLGEMLVSAKAPGWVQPWWGLHEQGTVVGKDGLQLIPSIEDGARFFDWGDPEPWGRWALAHRPHFRMRLLDMPEQSDLRITIFASAFVNEKHPTQSFAIYANAQLLGEWSHHAEKTGTMPKAHEWIIPAACFEVNGELEVTIVQEQSISPALLGMSTDLRLLGLAVNLIALHWTEKRAEQPNAQLEQFLPD